MQQPSLHCPHHQEQRRAAGAALSSQATPIKYSVLFSTRHFTDPHKLYWLCPSLTAAPFGHPEDVDHISIREDRAKERAGLQALGEASGQEAAEQGVGYPLEGKTNGGRKKKKGRTKKYVLGSPKVTECQAILKSMKTASRPETTHCATLSQCSLPAGGTWVWVYAKTQKQTKQKIKGKWGGI